MQEDGKGNKNSTNFLTTISSELWKKFFSVSRVFDAIFVIVLTFLILIFAFKFLKIVLKLKGIFEIGQNLDWTWDEKLFLIGSERKLSSKKLIFKVKKQL